MIRYGSTSLVFFINILSGLGLTASYLTFYVKKTYVYRKKISGL